MSQQRLDPPACRPDALVGAARVRRLALSRASLTKRIGSLVLSANSFTELPEVVLELSQLTR